MFTQYSSLKHLLAFVIVLFLSLVAFTAFAEPTVEIDPEADDIPQDVVSDIVNSNPDAGHITITDWGTAPAPDPSAPMPLSVQYINIKKTTLEINSVAKDVFVVSVARGETLSLETSLSASLSPSVTGGPSAANLSLKSTIKVTYSVGKTFTGPSESSQYNSREFRIKFYKNSGTYTATAVYSNNGANRQPVSGNWSEPSIYASYSIDRKIN